MTKIAAWLTYSCTSGTSMFYVCIYSKKRSLINIFLLSWKRFSDFINFVENYVVTLFNYLIRIYAYCTYATCRLIIDYVYFHVTYIILIILCSGTLLGWIFMVSVGFNAAVRFVLDYLPLTLLISFFLSFFSSHYFTNLSVYVTLHWVSKSNLTCILFPKISKKKSIYSYREYMLAFVW